MITINDICRQLEDCRVVTYDDDGTIIEITDVDKVLDLHLTLIVDLAERVQKLEQERDALVQLRQGKYATN
jgi:hypothetical protein